MGSYYKPYPTPPQLNRGEQNTIWTQKITSPEPQTIHIISALPVKATEEGAIHFSLTRNQVSTIEKTQNCSLICSMGSCYSYIITYYTILTQTINVLFVG